MPRRSIRKMAYEERLNAAIQERKFGATYRKAAEKYNVAISTLYARVNTPFHQRGRRCALQSNEEEMIVSFLLRFAKRGAPLNARHLQEAVKIVIDRMPPSRRILLPFNNNTPGRAFLRAFRQRHAAKLSFAKPLRQESNRMAAHNAQVLTHHFATLQKIIEENGLDSERIFNLDECGSTPERDMNGQTASRRFLPKRGSRDYRIADFRYLNRITMMPIISANGTCAPPLFVFKGSKLPYRTKLVGQQTVDETPACKLPLRSTLALRLENGSVDTVNFRNWGFSFVDYVKPLTANNRKVLLIYDAYRAHISLEVLQLFFENNIIVYALPAHSSGKTQPLDTVLFSVFKSSMNTVLANCTSVRSGVPLDLFDVCSILSEAYNLSFTSKNIRASFCRAGIWPLNPDRLLREELPANADGDSEMMSVDELQLLFEKRQAEYRNKILGSDAVMGPSGYVDTTNGCVMTSATVLGMVREKKEDDYRKFVEDERKRKEKEVKEERRRLGALRFRQRVHTDRLRRQALLGKISVEELTRRRRTMKERRTVARLRTEARKSLPQQ